MTLKKLTPVVKEAVDVFLCPGKTKDGGRSMLETAIGHARSTMVEHGILWTGALSYLIVMELVGSTVARYPKTKYDKRDDGFMRMFEAGVNEFSRKKLKPDEIAALYGLRSSLAHKFDLTSRPKNKKLIRHRFVLSGDGPLIKCADPPWDGSTRPSPVSDMSERRKFATAVNIEKIGEHAEAVVENLRESHRKGRVTLWTPGKAEDVIAFSQFFTDD